MSDMRSEPPHTPPTPPHTPPHHGAQGIVGRFLNFETMLGGSIIKILYYLGLAGIGLYVLISLLGAIRMLEYSAAAGLGWILLTLVFGVIGLVFWRVSCELWMIIFRIYDRLGEIRDRLPR